MAARMALGNGDFLEPSQPVLTTLSGPKDV